MRASRLISVLLLLQTRGRMTATELATELDVTTRTIYRDVEALNTAGVPIYADRGPTGGYQLLDGYRTRLTGLTGDEAQSLFLAGMPGQAAELGLGTVLAAAELKLRAALPPELRDRAGRIRERFHFDAPGWFRDGDHTPHLTAVADAVWNQSVIQVHYRRWATPRDITRTLCPLGVVLKAGTWYLIARSANAIRTYRVSQIRELHHLPDTFQRPADFDLVDYWATWSARFEASVYREEAAVRLGPHAMRMIFLLGPVVAQAAADTAGPPDEHGWVHCTLPIESVSHAVHDLLRLGGDAEVLEPRQLRDDLARHVHQLADRYPKP